MREIVPHGPLSRRSFLQSVAASGAAFVATPRLPAFIGFSPGSNSSHRAGLLMPAFKSHPQVGASFLDGFALYLAQQPALRAMQMFAASTGSQAGITEEEVTKFCEEAGLEIVVSMANPSSATAVGAALWKAGVPLLVSHAGANRLDAREPSLFYNSLGYWQASYRAGAWAAQRLGRKAVVVSSFYESGYDALYAFEQGLTKEGGRVRAHFVTHVPGRSLSMAALMAQIADAGADFVYAHSSGAAAADFMTAFSSSRRTRNMPLFGSTFLLEEAAQGPPPATVRNLYSAGSWSPLLQSAQNEAFQQAFWARYRRAADSFAVLGYDTAGLIAEAARLAQAQGLSLAAALRQTTVDGPRGRLAIDGATQAALPPLYLRQWTWQDGAYQSAVVEALPPVAETAARNAAPRSGWIHPYLSI